MGAKINGLTPRQFEMVQYLACGLSHKEIADTLDCSPSTVTNTLRAVYSVIGLNKESEITAWYLCTFHGTSTEFDLVGRIRRAVSALALVLLVSFQIVASPDDNLTRVRRPRSRRQEIENVQIS